MNETQQKRINGNTYNITELNMHLYVLTLVTVQSLYSITSKRYYSYRSHLWHVTPDEAAREIGLPCYVKGADMPSGKW